MSSDKSDSNKVIFFSLKNPEDIKVSIMGLNFYKWLMEDKNAPINRLEGEFQEALLKLMAMMFNLTQTEEENDEEIGEEDDEETEVAEEYRLDFQESFALLHALV